MTTLEENDDKRVIKVEVPSGVSELTSKYISLYHLLIMITNIQHALF